MNEWIIITTTIITWIELPLGGSNSYTSTEKEIRINVHEYNKNHSTNFIKNSKYIIYYQKNPHNSQNKLKQLQYKLNNKEHSQNTINTLRSP